MIRTVRTSTQHAGLLIELLQGGGGVRAPKVAILSDTKWKISYYIGDSDDLRTIESTEVPADCYPRTVQVPSDSPGMLETLKKELSFLGFPALFD